MRFRIAFCAAVCLAGFGLVLLQLPAKGHSSAAPSVVAVAITPSSEYIAAAVQDGTIQIWRTQSWHPFQRFRARGGGLNTIAFSRDSKLMAIAGRFLSLWTTSHWHEWKRMGAADVVYGTARFDPSGLHLATVNSSEQIDVWNVQAGTRFRSLCCAALYGDLAFDPMGKVLAVAGHWPRLWNLSTGQETLRLVRSRNPTFACIQFDGEGQFLATGSQDGIARIWRASTGELLFASRPRDGYIETIAFQPGGNWIAYGSPGRSLWLWNPWTAKEFALGAIGSNAVFSADGRLLAFGTPGLLHVFDMANGRERIALRFIPEN